MKVACILHADFEKPGITEDWARERGHIFQMSRPYAGEPCPLPSTYDFLIVMGGPQSPLALKEFPYLGEEIKGIKRAVQDDKPVLGFCLGAQLIGEALGGKTQKSPEKEVGVYPITLTAAAQEDPVFSLFPSTFSVIHWHNDMPGVTDAAILLAKSEGCPHQAFCYAPRVYGLQFHMEITREGIAEMIQVCPDDLKESRFTQSPDTLLSQDYEPIHQRMRLMLDHLTAL